MGAVMGAGRAGAETYRYHLSRSWDDCKSMPLVFVMLNPSTADHEVDDPTIRRCIGFARREGYCSIEVVNLFAWRATDPKELPSLHQADRIGEDNYRYIHAAVTGASAIVCAWGAIRPQFESERPRPEGIARANGIPVYCLGTTKAGHPRHPLYVRGDAPLERWPQ